MAAEKKDNTLAYGILAVGVGLGVYALTSSGSNSNSSGTNYQVPPGGGINYGGGTWQNTTGQPVWLTATGVIMNAGGQLLGNINQLMAALNQGGGATGGNANPESGNGHWQDANGELTWVPNVTGKRGIGWQTGKYYNPLPGGLM